MEGPLVDRLDQSVEEDAHGGTTSPNNGLDQPNEPPPNASPASPSPVLRRSSRMRKPPARYGECITYPDCYSSSSDLD